MPLALGLPITNQYEYYGLGGWALCMMCILIPIVITILIAVWLYKDAEKRGSSGALWVVILILATLFLSFIGMIIVIIIWLVIRGPERPPGYMPPPGYGPPAPGYPPPPPPGYYPPPSGGYPPPPPPGY